jgi:hypothetical protein
VVVKTEITLRFGTIEISVPFFDKTNIRTHFLTVESLIVFSPGTRSISCVMASPVHFALWKKATTERGSMIWSWGTDFNGIFTTNNRAYFVFH